ncbi:helix-turn-helix transcriptional regulator [Streptomyces sp. NPDC093109]|uniref:helix-turn-helix transcriptional regulator n=1 Tax=Streptomyces sp. NPDC093109 TaxID=3154977 RepID=UPI003450F916
MGIGGGNNSERGEGEPLPQQGGVTAPSDAEDSLLTPGQLMGLAGLLRAWRAAASKQLGRQITQRDVGLAAGRSDRWYRDLESGATMRLDRKQCEAIGEILGLGRDELQALILYSVGGGLSVDPTPTGDTSTRRALQLLIDKQLPSPTYLTDAWWNVIGYNAAMASWWPWVMEDKPNLMRWALLSREARVQFHDWPHHAAEYVKLLKAAIPRHPDEPELAELIGDLRKDPDVRTIWDSSTDIAENRDGHTYRMTLPALNWESAELVSHVLYPASLPDCRLTVITWTRGQDGAEAHGSSAGHPLAPITPNSGAHEAIRQQVARRLSHQITTASAAEAAALAGTNRVPLPVLGRILGDDCRLTYAPSTRTVIWATRQDDDRWNIAEVAPYTIIVRIPQAIHIEGASAEYKILTRAILPADPSDAVQRVQTLIAQLRRRIVVLESIHRDEYEADPKNIPYLWHPVDEI